MAFKFALVIRQLPCTVSVAPTHTWTLHGHMHTHGLAVIPPGPAYSGAQGLWWGFGQQRWRVWRNGFNGHSHRPECFWDVHDHDWKEHQLALRVIER